VINGGIVLLLGLMVLQGMPLNMNAANGGARYIADWLGIGHETWNLYAPEPDRQNHRLTAEIMSDENYVLAHWSSPHWPDLSPAQRFRMHRWTEYYDNVWMNDHSACWSPLSRHIYRTAKIPPAEDNQPRQVRLIREWNFLPEPKGDRWPKPVPPETYTDSHVLHIEPLP
jgi:hypothetical protein